MKQVLFPLLAVSSLLACSKPNDDGDVKDAIAANSLVGSWSICSPEEGGSSTTQYTFSPAGEFSIDIVRYSDSSCKTLLTQAEADAQTAVLIQTLISSFGALAEDLVKTKEFSSTLSFHHKGTYKKIGANGLDYTVDDETVFTSYQIKDKILTIAYDCLVGNLEEGCPVITGNSDANRAVDFGKNAFVFNKI